MNLFVCICFLFLGLTKGSCFLSRNDTFSALSNLGVPIDMPAGSRLVTALNYALKPKAAILQVCKAFERNVNVAQAATLPSWNR